MIGCLQSFRQLEIPLEVEFRLSKDSSRRCLSNQHSPTALSIAGCHTSNDLRIRTIGSLHNYDKLVLGLAIRTQLLPQVLLFDVFQPR